MITVCVLKSLFDGASYVGMAKNVDARLQEHNSGKNRYTKDHLPWIIIYKETHPDWASVRVREKYLKSTAGKRWIVATMGEGINKTLSFNKANVCIATGSGSNIATQTSGIVLINSNLKDAISLFLLAIWSRKVYTKYSISYRLWYY
jgi:putative endonuclease